MTTSEYERTRSAYNSRLQRAQQLAGEVLELSAFEALGTNAAVASKIRSVLEARFIDVFDKLHNEAREYFRDSLENYGDRTELRQWSVEKAGAAQIASTPAELVELARKIYWFVRTDAKAAEIASGEPSEASLEELLVLVNRELQKQGPAPDVRYKAVSALANDLFMVKVEPGQEVTISRRAEDGRTQVTGVEVVPETGGRVRKMREDEL